MKNAGKGAATVRFLHPEYESKAVEQAYKRIMHELDSLIDRLRYAFSFDRDPVLKVESHSSHERVEIGSFLARLECLFGVKAEEAVNVLETIASQYESQTGEQPEFNNPLLGAIVVKLARSKSFNKAKPAPDGPSK